MEGNSNGNGEWVAEGEVTQVGDDKDRQGEWKKRRR